MLHIDLKKNKGEAMKKYRLKKSALIFIFLILLIIIALILLIKSLFTNKSYSLEYNIDDFDVSENYVSDEKVYYYQLTYEGTKYDFVYPSKYLKDKRLIDEIEPYTFEDYTCLIIESDYVESNPLCSYDGDQIDYRLIPEELELPVSSKKSEEKDEYENYTIYNKDNKILIWNYKGFNYLNKGEIEKINLFDKDIYEVSIIARVNNYVIIPDYEQSYSFNRIFIINLDNLKVETWKIKYDISFDSYILGTNKESIYLMDKKNKTEYELVPHKKKMRIIATDNRNGILIKDGKEEKEPVNNIINSKEVFTYENKYHYTLKDNRIYLTYLDMKNETIISSDDVKEIIYIEEDAIYYLIKDTLYKYDLKYGETKLITFSEWNYNYQNSIIIY